MEDRTSVHRAYALLIAATTMWGVGTVAGKFILFYLTPLLYSFVTSLISCAPLLPSALSRSHGPVNNRLRKREISIISLPGALSFILISFGLRLSSAVDAGILLGLTPVHIALLSARFLDDRLSMSRIIGLVASVLGVGFVVSGGNLSFQKSAESLWGNLIIALSGVAWSIFSVLAKLVSGRVGVLKLALASQLWAAILSLPFMLLEQSSGSIYSAPWQVWLAILYSSIFAVSLGNLMYLRGIERIGATGAGVFQDLAPVTTLLVSVAILGEGIGLGQLLGIAGVSVGVLLVSRRQELYPRRRG